jgi:allantoin racemase
MKKRILWIDPVIDDGVFPALVKDLSREICSPEVEVDVINLKEGPSTLEYFSVEADVIPEVVKLVKDASNAGYDGAVLGCFFDPGLRAAREVSGNMVVTAPAESTMLLASVLGYKFSVLIGRKKWIPRMMENVLVYGLKDRLASFKPMDIGVAQMQEDHGQTRNLMIQAARDAINKDGAEVIILGCTNEYGFYKELQSELRVPVIDPVIAPIKFAEYLIEMKNRFNWHLSRIGDYQGPAL